MFDTLPSEILYHIADFLPPNSVCAVGRVSRRLHAIFTPIVYQSITLRATNEWALNVLDVDSFFLHHDYGRAQDCLRHTRHLCFQAPIQLVRFSRCAYYSIFRMTGMDGCSPDAMSEVVAHKQFLRDLELQVSRIFSCLNPHSLRTFEWKLGTCVPTSIFEADGYLARYQPHIEHLNLLTDGTCFHARHGLGGLSQLRTVKDLKWDGIQHREEVESLRGFLRCNHSHLESLSVGFTPSAFANSLSWNHLVGLGPGDGVCRTPTSMTFPSLTQLSLSQITLPSHFPSDECFTFHTLRSLSLRYCPNQLRLLHLLSKEPDKIQLDSLESCFDFLQDDHRHANAISQFLLSFNGLRNLYLHMSNFPPLGSDFVEGIRAHRATLKWLVYHERQLAPLDDSGLFEEDRDVSPNWVGELDHAIDQRQVTFLALSICPRAARTCLEPAREHSQLQLLHLRFSGPERLHLNLAQEIRALLLEIQRASSVGVCAPGSYFQGDNLDTHDPSRSTHIASLQSSALPHLAEAKAFLSFATWAFSPQGIPSLKALAFGDFSHEDRYEAQRFLIRRRDPSKESQATSEYPDFVPFEVADLDTWEGFLGDGARFLAACPGGGLMESPYDF
ncbi:hypothetical protein POX_f07413 [Penicillium oxalicum]|uniref:hypothetical protein n=1 Tax=Penicillium oxalicum TaxID=69781 RepID=UPI0020B7992A|nr:hypothetical protein POX_f07413 [Penicillium oxalicum]KAI2787058.1 hypothetical protein POX_f07413 [Penicillium oxalicum]